MALKIATSQEPDGRWMAKVIELTDVVATGNTPESAIKRAQALALRALAEQVDRGEMTPAIAQLFTIS